MKSKIRKIVAVILCAIMITSTAQAAVFAADTREKIDSGICGAQGDNLKWTLYDDGELVISGKGEMDWYFVSNIGAPAQAQKLPPWYGYYDKIKVITIEDGVESIGSHAFVCYGAQYYKINLPTGLKYYEVVDGRTPFAYSDIAADGIRLRAICFEGADRDLVMVEKKYKLSNNVENGTIEREYVSESDYISILHFKKHEIFYYGHQPEPHITLGYGDDLSNVVKKGEVKKYYAKYYYEDVADAKIVWHDSGRAFEAEYIINENDGLTGAAELTSVRYGKQKLWAEIVNGKGEIIAKSTVIKPHTGDYEGMSFGEKVASFFDGVYKVFILGSFSAVLIIVGAVLAVVSAIRSIFR